MGMLRVSIAIAAYFLGSPLHAVTIPHAEAGKHIGQEVTVNGKVSGVRTIPSGMTFVNFGVRGAADAFTAVGKPGVVDGQALQAYQGKNVEVSGTVELYKDSPQIVLKAPESIRLSGAAPAPESGAPKAGIPDLPKPAETAPGVFEIEPLDLKLEREEVRMAGKSPSGFVPTNAKVFIAMPKDFKPQAGQRVLAVVPDFKSEEDLEKLVRQHAEVSVPKGWVVLTAHCPTPDEFPTDGLYAAVISGTMRHLASKYPGAEDWPLFIAGSSMGAGRASLASGALIKGGFDVQGIFLSSLKWQDLTKSIKTFSPLKSAVRKMKVYVSHGEKDFYASKAQSLEEAQEIREAGVKEVRHEVHPGRGGMDAASLAKALDWFMEPE
jgi:hypothetical protein